MRRTAHKFPSVKFLKCYTKFLSTCALRVIWQWINFMNLPLLACVQWIQTLSYMLKKTHYKSQMLFFFLVSQSNSSREHICLPLAFWCTFHFWHLLYMQYPVVLCPERRRKKHPKWRARSGLLNQTVWVAKSNLPAAALFLCKDTSGRFSASKGLWLQAFGDLG